MAMSCASSKVASALWRAISMSLTFTSRVFSSADEKFCLIAALPFSKACRAAFLLLSTKFLASLVSLIGLRSSRDSFNSYVAVLAAEGWSLPSRSNIGTRRLVFQHYFFNDDRCAAFPHGRLKASSRGFDEGQCAAEP